MNIQSFIKWILAISCSVLGTVAHSAADQARFALVIGNGAYSSIGALPNPPADAQLISKTLGDLGFETTLILDSDQLTMKKAIANFGRTLRNANKEAVGFFYYAGHGVQAQGRNYLLPVEATPTDQADLDLMGVEANWVLRQMESAGNRTNIVVLDACRNNPFVAANRSLGRGLAQIDAPTGSFISYATAPGKVALDGDGANSPFSTALAEAMTSPGLAIEQVFKQVRINVIKATNGTQIPWDSSSLVEDFYINPSEQKKVGANLLAAAPTVATTEIETQLWESVKVSGNPDRISLFLQIYPRSSYAPEARSLLTKSLLALHPATDSKTKPVKQANTGNTPTANTQPVITTNPSQANSADNREQEQQGEAEFDLFNVAQASGQREDYQRYQESYPRGIFIDLVEAEIAHIDSSADADNTAIVVASANDTLTKAPVLSAETTPISEDGIQLDSSADWLFETPVTADTANSEGPRSLFQLSQGNPLFPPFEGLDKSYWESQQCSNCHNWNQSSLCVQGEFYVAAEEQALERIKHPYGGFFKKTLRKWAVQGCK